MKATKVCMENMVCLFKSERMKCGTVEVVKNSTRRWFGHFERIRDEITKKIYMTGVNAVDDRKTLSKIRR